MAFGFRVLGAGKDGAARLGLILTPHGAIETPAFAPVGTQGTVKALDPRDLRDLGVQIVLSNTYHLHLRPGADLVEKMGGLHRFMGWGGPILTDSGGFQLFSLAAQRRVDEDGVTFRSHIDGSSHRLTPEKVVRVQEQLGADIIMCLDECADPHDRAYNEEALARTHVWAARCQAAHRRPDQALFGIVQGGVFADLRQESARFLVALDFPGYAMGGLSVGETKDEMYRTLDITAPLLPAHKPRYLMGVGSPEDLVEGVARGIDLFDCVLPTRLARNAAVFTREGRLNLRNAQFCSDPRPLEVDCSCYACRHFSRAYLRHLYKAEELLAYRLASIHNVHFLQRLMLNIRTALAEERFSEFRADFLANYHANLVREDPSEQTNRGRRQESWSL
jgi:queuine tRNA-ribosyltransferase